MRNTSLIGRVAALVALVIAVVAVVVILFSGGSSYHVYAVFQDASQLVTGDQVDVAQAPIGTISNITLTQNGMARIELNISDSHYQPLRQGTIATVRVPSLSSVANRYLELRLAPGNARPIANGGTIGPQNTNSAVNIDAIFNTLNGPTRKGLQDLIQGSASQWKGQASKAQAAWKRPGRARGAGDDPPAAAGDQGAPTLPRDAGRNDPGRILKNPIPMIEFLVKRTDGDWFDLPVGSGAYRPKTVPYEAVGTDEQAIRIGECEVSFSFEDPGIQICFHGDIAEELAERVASEVLERIEITGQEGEVIRIT